MGEGRGKHRAPVDRLAARAVEQGDRVLQLLRGHLCGWCDRMGGNVIEECGNVTAVVAATGAGRGRGEHGAPTGHDTRIAVGG